MRRWMAVLLVMVLVFAMAAPGVAVAKAKPKFVSHPYTAKQTYKVGADIRTWGYVAPKVSDFTSRTVDILIYKRTAAGKWDLVKTVESTDTTLYNRAHFKHRTFYRAMFQLEAAGRYRMKARYGWKGVDGLMKYKSGSYKYFRVK